MSLGTAFRAFFAALGNRKASDAIQKLLDEGVDGPAKISPPAAAAPVSKGAAAAGPPPLTEKKAVRSDAVALLSMLQRESRLVDLIQEPLDQYSDAQVGAAARPCLKQCQQTLQRIFDLKPLADQAEGATIAVPANASPIRYQRIGSATAATTGRIVHPGWRASRCELGQWTGEAADAQIVAPIQIES